MKICTQCNIEKDFCEFSKCSRSKLGVQSSCKKCIKEYYINNRVKTLSHQKEYYIKNKEKLLSYQKEYNIKNREKKQSYLKEYFIKNRENIRYYQNEYERNKRLNDPIFKLTRNVRIRLYLYLKTTGITKSKRTFDIVGCSPPELKEHLERQFVDGMSWEKMGKDIHIDHIIPLSSANNEYEIYKLCHYSNLQPLWAEDNLKKSDKIINF